MTNEEVIRSWFKRFWDEADKSAVDDLVAPDLTATGMAHAGAITPDEIRQFADVMFRHIKDIKTEFHRFIDQGEWIAFHFTMHAKDCQNDAPVTLDCQTMVHIVDGKLQSGINHVDWISFFQQLGKVPPNTMEDLMAGCSYRQA